MATTITTSRSTRKREVFYYFLNAFLITNLLCFVDEGYYDFRWMTNIGNWIIFFIYTAVLFGVQSFFALVVLRHFISRNARIAVTIGGTMLFVVILTLGLFLRS